MPFRSSLAFLLALHMLFALNPANAQTPAPAQTPPAAAPAGIPAAGQTPVPVAPASAGPQGQIAAPMVQSLKVIALQGDRAVNDIAARIGVQPVIEVRDDNDRPVEGANVIFRLPPNGPGGAFDGKSVSKSARTNSEGQAGVTGFAPNSEAGPFEIHVTAILGNRMGQGVIHETNAENRLVMAPAPLRKTPLWRNKWVLIGGGVAIAGGVVAAVLLSGSKKPVTITPGTVTINQ